MNDETHIDERLRRALRAPEPPPDLAARILAQRPPRKPRRWPALAAAAGVLLALGLWPSPYPPGEAFVAHARDEARLQRLAGAPPLAGVELMKRCRVAGRDYLHLRLRQDGQAVDAFVGTPPPGLMEQGRAGDRLWRRLDRDGRSLVLVYPPGLDPVPVAERILAHLNPSKEVPRT